MLQNNKKIVDIKLGSEVLKASVPTLLSASDLISKQTKGEISDIEFSLNFLFLALKNENPDLTLEELQNYITVDMASDLADAFTILGINPKKK